MTAGGMVMVDHAAFVGNATGGEAVRPEHLLPHLNLITPSFQYRPREQPRKPAAAMNPNEPNSNSNSTLVSKQMFPTKSLESDGCLGMKQGKDFRAC
jgi:hypothetical protein